MASQCFTSLGLGAPGGLLATLGLGQALLQPIPYVPFVTGRLVGANPSMQALTGADPGMLGLVGANPSRITLEGPDPSDRILDG